MSNFLLFHSLLHCHIPILLQGVTKQSESQWSKYHSYNDLAGDNTNTKVSSNMEMTLSVTKQHLIYNSSPSSYRPSFITTFSAPRRACNAYSHVNNLGYYDMRGRTILPFANCFPVPDCQPLIYHSGPVQMHDAARRVMFSINAFRYAAEGLSPREWPTCFIIWLSECHRAEE